MQSVIGILVFVRDAILAMVMAWIGIGFTETADRSPTSQKNGAVASSCPNERGATSEPGAGGQSRATSYSVR